MSLQRYRMLPLRTDRLYTVFRLKNTAGVGYIRCCSTFVRKRSELKSQYDAVVIGAGHNGLVAAAYLQKAGKKVCVLERRGIVGGAAVTEEIIPGFKCSRVSYMLSLLRPQVYQELELAKHGLSFYMSDTDAFTPLVSLSGGMDGKARSLIISADENLTRASIAQFSKKDAQNYYRYEDYLSKMADIIKPLVDTPPPMLSLKPTTFREKLALLQQCRPLLKTGSKTLKEGLLLDMYTMMTSPSETILEKWFESAPLRATLAAGSVTGAMGSPRDTGSGYLLLHLLMGGLEVDGVNGAWVTVKGGMGSVSDAIAKSAASVGTHIFTDATVSSVMLNSDKEATGVVLENGTEIRSECILSNITPRLTYNLVPKDMLPEKFMEDLSHIDYSSGATKINVAVSRIPDFLAEPAKNGEPGRAHRATIHLNCEHPQKLYDAYVDGQHGIPSKEPVIEMTIPSAQDPTLAPSGAHVVQMFVQYTPYTRSDGRPWDDQSKQEYANHVFDVVERYAPGFKSSILGTDILTPPDLERIFGLTGGNCFHGAMALNQLFFARPLPAYCDYRSPLGRLYMCGSSTHPGGGVMGSAGRLAAMAALQDHPL